MLALIDVLKSDAVEGEFLTGENDMQAIARKLASYGPKEIVLTHKDGLLVLANGSRACSSRFMPRELRGRSGRGDTCVGFLPVAPPERRSSRRDALGRGRDQSQARSGRPDAPQRARMSKRSSATATREPEIERRAVMLRRRFRRDASALTCLAALAGCAVRDEAPARSSAADPISIARRSATTAITTTISERRTTRRSLTEEQFMAKERKDWVDEQRPLEEFEPSADVQAAEQRQRDRGQRAQMPVAIAMTS